MEDNSNFSGKKIVTAKGTRANIKSIYKNTRFTVIGLTAASGDTVMCIIFFAAKDLTFEQPMGFDIRAPFDEDTIFRENTGVGKAFPRALVSEKNPSPRCHESQRINHL